MYCLLKDFLTGEETRLCRLILTSDLWRSTLTCMPPCLPPENIKHLPYHLFMIFGVLICFQIDGYYGNPTFHHVNLISELSVRDGLGVQPKTLTNTCLNVGP